jgi:TonB family protein
LLCKDKIKADLNSLFGDKCINNKVKARWVTGSFISPQGKLLYYVHMGNASIYEKEVEFYFKEGKFVGTKTYDNSKSKTSIYKEDQKKLSDFINRQIKWNCLPKNKESIRVFVQFSANNEGIIDSTKILRGYNDSFDNEAIRVIKTIPKWGILYSRGEFMRMNWTMPVTFSEENRLKYSHKN